MRLVFSILFHSLPVYPMVLERWYLFVAALLLVFMPYIKVRKLEAELAEYLNSSESKENKTTESQIRAAIERWKYLTFKKFI